jgi:hypothetical protein
MALGPGSLFEAVGSSHAAELARYEAVIHLRTPDPKDYTYDNPMRIESAVQAAAIDEEIARAWHDHSRVYVVDRSASFLDKAAAAVALVREHLPACCA